MRIDYLTAADKDDYIELIEAFGDCNISDGEWNVFFEEYEESDSRVIYIARIFDKNLNSEIIVGTCSILVEPKMHRHLKRCIHLEDVVIAARYRKLGLGKQMMRLLLDEAKSYGAYKIILDCNPKNVEFYESCGFYQNEVHMRLDV